MSWVWTQESESVFEASPEKVRQAVGLMGWSAEEVCGLKKGNLCVAFI